MRGLRLHRGAAACLLALALACGSAQASGLQVSPVSLTLQPTRNADGLWLSNTGTNVVHAQVRVYHWTQQGGVQQLTPSQGLVASPPMLNLASGDKQLIRVIRIGPPPTGTDAAEDAYRISIDELPVDDSGKAGLQFVLHYSVPVFVEPAGVPPTTPSLQWKLRRAGDRMQLQVDNSGTGHAQLAGVSYVDPSGHRIEIAKGLLGYVLPKGDMRWELKQPAASFVNGGHFEATVNGGPVTQSTALETGTR